MPSSTVHAEPATPLALTNSVIFPTWRRSRAIYEQPMLRMCLACGALVQLPRRSCASTSSACERHMNECEWHAGGVSVAHQRCVGGTSAAHWWHIGGTYVVRQGTLIARERRTTGAGSRRLYKLECSNETRVAQPPPTSVICWHFSAFVESPATLLARNDLLSARSAARLNTRRVLAKLVSITLAVGRQLRNCFNIARAWVL